MKQKQRALFGLVAALMLVLTGFSGLASTRAASLQNDSRPTLRFGLNAQDLGSLDPHFASSTNDRTVVDMVFNALVRFQPGNSNVIEPDLATAVPEPAMANGKQVWTFNLRKGVMCQPGPKSQPYELTADDVVASLQKSADKNRSSYSGDYDGMTFAKTDPYTVTITLDQPLSKTLFLPKVANYSGGYIVCSKALAAMGDDAFKTHPVGTGPFMFGSYAPQDKIELKAWDKYFRGQPKLAGVDLRFMPDISSRENALKAGDLDVAQGTADTEWINRVKGDENLKVDVFGVGEVAFINFNITKKPLDDVRVRQAIAYAINRDDHLALFGGKPAAEEVYSVAPAQLMKGGLTEEQAKAAGVLYEHNVDKAKELLKEAGYADGFSLDVITSEDPAYQKEYQVLQAELGDVGITLNVKVVDHTTYHAQIRKDVNPLTIYVAWRPNADAYLTQFFLSDSIVVTGAKPNTNFSHYTKIDDLIKQARNETDPAKQDQLWQQANTQILKDMVAYPILFTNQVYARSTKVDYGHELVSVYSLNPQITELTSMTK